MIYHYENINVVLEYMEEQFKDEGYQYDHKVALPEIIELNPSLFDDEKNNSELGQEAKIGVAYDQFYILQAKYRNEREMAMFAKVAEEMQAEREATKKREEEIRKRIEAEEEEKRLKEEKKAKRKERIRNFFRCQC